jgi:hypothetical protein
MPQSRRRKQQRLSLLLLVTAVAAVIARKQGNRVPRLLFPVESFEFSLDAWQDSQSVAYTR